MALVILTCAGSPLSLGADYYIDSSSVGNDSNSGTAPDSPWRNLSKVNNTRFWPGDRILFKRGGLWKGYLSVNDAGTAAAPIVFGTYGDPTAPKPSIDAEGKHSAVILVKPEVSHCKIEGFRLTNLIDSIYTGSEGQLCGIMLAYSESVETVDIHLVGNEIVNIEGFSNTPGTIPRGAEAVADHAHQYSNAGIYVRSFSTTKLRIEGNEIRDSTCAGIIVQTFGGDRGRGFGTRIEHNSISNVGSDGIVLINQDAPLVQYNLCVGAGNNSGKSPQAAPVLGSNGLAVAGMWAKGCNSALFQYNYCEGTKKIQYDGQAWDFDHDNRGTLIYQFNYSRDNEGGFLLSTGKEDGLVKICRYNISVNDGSKQNVDGQGFFNRHADCHNNVFYRDDGKAFEMAAYGPLAVTGTFSNNVFYLGAPTSVETVYHEGDRVFRNNFFFGHHPTSPGDGAVFGDPLFVKATASVKFKPGAYPFTQDEFRKALAGFRLLKKSPLIDRGVSGTSNGEQDFWGNPLRQGPANIGVDDSTGIVENSVD